MKKTFSLLLKIVISTGLIALLLKRIGPDYILSTLENANWIWITAALVLFTVSYFLGSLQWWTLLKAEGVRIPFRKTLQFYYVGLFFNNLFISNLGGDVFRMVDIRRYSEDGAAAVSTVFLDRVMGLLLMSGLAVLSSPFLLIHQSTDLKFLPFLFVLIAGWTIVLFTLFSKRFARPFIWLVTRITPEKLHLKGREIYNRIYSFGRQKSCFIRVFLISLCVQSARILTHYLLSRSLGLHVSPLYFFLFIPIVAIIASLPVSIGGLGLREQSAVILFGAVGMAASDATVMEFLAYLVAIVTSIPGGLLFIGRNKIQSGLVESSPA
ncbi:flippase-like domain-containing protein [candidate division KSB1 bacterium]|nr:flippase-like domain-containing protein [candidate division KSB1 bacterium]